MRQIIQKQAIDDLDFKFDFAPITNAPTDECSWGLNGCDWLEPGEKIMNWSLDDPAPDTINIHDAALQDEATSILFFAAGGEPGVDYTVRCHITTTSMPARSVSAAIILRVI